MKRYLVLDGTLVVNDIICGEDYPITPNLIEVELNPPIDNPGPGIGWSYVNNIWVEPAPYVPSADQNKTTAVNLLAATDWTSVADVGNPQLSNPYLANQAAFIQWRSQIRAVAVNPVAGVLDIFAQQPKEEWVTV